MHIESSMMTGCAYAEPALLNGTLKQEEKNNPNILSTSFIHVDPYIDQPDMGGGAIIITNDDLKTAEKISLDYSKQYWDRRIEFEPVLFSPKEAVLKGISIDKNILLVETADACGGGAVGDSVQSLRELINFAPNKKSLVHVNNYKLLINFLM